MNHNPLKLKPFSGSALKVIAVISMTIDHIALYVMARNLHIQEFWLYEVLRGFGRLAFPIFAFLVIEGFFHSHNVLRYMATLLIFAIVSEIPWYLLGQYGSHNVLFTLLLGLIAVYLTDRIPKDLGIDHPFPFCGHYSIMDQYGLFMAWNRVNDSILSFQGKVPFHLSVWATFST